MPKPIDNLILNSLSLYKFIFFIITMIINFLLMIIDIVIIITLNNIDFRLCGQFSNWCKKHLDQVLQLEFKILFKKESK